jgi:hypothetical protein
MKDKTVGWEDGDVGEAKVVVPLATGTTPSWYGTDTTPSWYGMTDVNPSMPPNCS